MQSKANKNDRNICLAQTLVHQVVPFMHAYIADNYADLSAKMAKFWRKCFDILNKNIHKREKERGESKLRFQVRAGF